MLRIILILVFIFFWGIQVIWGITLPSGLERYIPKESSPTDNNISTAIFLNPCKRSGLACKSCSEVIKCIEIFPGYYEEYPIKRCLEGETCLINQCSAAHNPKCANKEAFSCVATSLFPDPYDCQIFHICVLAKSIIVPLNSNEKATDFHVAVKCAGNYAYNINTHLCDIPLQDGTCSDEPPIPDCSKMPLGFAKALGTSPYYFMCIDNGHGQLRPIIHICPHGKRYKASGKCEFVDKLDKNIQEVDNIPSATETESVWIAPPSEILQNINKKQLIKRESQNKENISFTITDHSLYETLNLQVVKKNEPTNSPVTQIKQMNLPIKEDSQFTTEEDIKQTQEETTKIVIPSKKFVIGVRVPPRKITEISSNIPGNESTENSLEEFTDNQKQKNSGNSEI